MSLVLLYINSTFFWKKGRIYFPSLHFLTISKYSDSFLLFFFKPIVDMVISLTHWIKYFQNIDAGKFEYRKKKTAK